MFKRVSLPAALILLSACAPGLSPQNKAAVDANIARNAPKQAVTSSNGAYSVAIAGSGKVALVKPTRRNATIAGIEAAAAEVSGCAAQVVQNTYAAMGNDRAANIPISEFGKFGGAMPVVLTCS